MFEAADGLRTGLGGNFMSLPIALYTAEEVAEKLRVSRRSVYQWLSSGKLGGFKAGQAWRITEDDLTMFMKRRNLPDKSGQPPGGEEERSLK